MEIKIGNAALENIFRIIDFIIFLLRQQDKLKSLLQRNTHSEKKERQI